MHKGPHPPQLTASNGSSSSVSQTSLLLAVIKLLLTTRNTTLLAQAAEVLYRCLAVDALEPASGREPEPLRAQRAEHDPFLQCFREQHYMGWLLGPLRGLAVGGLQTADQSAEQSAEGSAERLAELSVQRSCKLAVLRQVALCVRQHATPMSDYVLHCNLGRTVVGLLDNSDTFVQVRSCLCSW
jgi:hypothetical protein